MSNECGVQVRTKKRKKLVGPRVPMLVPFRPNDQWSSGANSGERSVGAMDDRRISSPSSTGGAGTFFEQHVGAYWLAQLLVRGIPPIPVPRSPAPAARTAPWPPFLAPAAGRAPYPGRSIACRAPRCVAARKTAAPLPAPGPGWESTAASRVRASSSVRYRGRVLGAFGVGTRAMG